MSLNMKDVLTEQAEAAASETVKLGAWRSVFERVNRIITGEPVKVEIAPEGPAAGWSDGRTIYFHKVLLNEMLRTTDKVGAILRLKGLNYHELSHILYTPRASDELTKQIRKRAENDGGSANWFYALNALEDQRIETLFAAAYGPSRRYFEAMILEWIIKNGTTESAILLHGRKYLPARIRIQADRLFVKKYGEDLHGRFVDVIEAYSKLLYPADTTAGVILISKYKFLLDELQRHHAASLPKLPVPDNGARAIPGQRAQGGEPGGFMSTGKPDKDAGQEARKRVEKQKEDIEAEEAEAKADLDAEAKKEAPATDKADEESDSDGEGGGSGQDEGPEADDTGTGQGDSQSGPGGQGAGTDSSETPPEIVPDLTVRDLIEEASDWMDDVYQDEYIQEDAASVMDAVTAEIRRRIDMVEGVRQKSLSTLTPDSDTLIAQRRVRQIIQRIQSEAEPSILHRQRTGRVDITRVINARPEDLDIFRSYDSGNEEEAGLELVVLLDVSGSMNQRQEEASTAVWVLKRALDRLDIPTTVLVYNTRHYVLYQPGEKAPSRVQVVQADGGTDPRSAYEQAAVVLRQSDKTNKALVNVTDGSWSNAPASEAIVAMLNRQGVHTMLLGLGGTVATYGSHGHTMSADLNSIRGLPAIVTRLVESIIRTATGNV